MNQEELNPAAIDFNRVYTIDQVDEEIRELQEAKAKLGVWEFQERGKFSTQIAIQKARRKAIEKYEAKSEAGELRKVDIGDLRQLIDVESLRVVNSLDYSKEREQLVSCPANSFTQCWLYTCNSHSQHCRKVI